MEGGGGKLSSESSPASPPSVVMSSLWIGKGKLVLIVLELELAVSSTELAAIEAGKGRP